MFFNKIVFFFFSTNYDEHRRGKQITSDRLIMVTACRVWPALFFKKFDVVILGDVNLC